jgi:hypothetical protein
LRKEKIYLETTLFNFYFDKNKVGHISTVALFDDIGAGFIGHIHLMRCRMNLSAHLPKSGIR